MTAADQSPSKRAADLMRAAKDVAEANTLDFVAELESLIARAAEIAQGGDAYAPGVREVCQTFSHLGARRAEAITAVLRDRSLDRRQIATPLRAAPERRAPQPAFLLSPDARLAASPEILERLASFGRRS